MKKVIQRSHSSDSKPFETEESISTVFGGFELGCSENNPLHHLQDIAKFGAAEGKIQSFRDTEGNPLWSGELFKGLEELVSLGQAAGTAPCPGSCPGVSSRSSARMREPISNCSR